jgi:hypothetical protein
MFGSTMWTRLAGVILLLSFLSPVQAQITAGLGMGAAPPPTIFSPNHNMALNQYADRSGLAGQGTGNFYTGIPPLGADPRLAPGYANYLPYVGGPALTTTQYQGPTLSTSPPPSSYLPYQTYLNPYLPYYDPYGGFLRGVGDVTLARSQAVGIIQDARLTHQEVLRSQLDTRAKLMEHLAELERRFRPDPEKIRLEEMQTALSRARTNPPLNEVWSGKSINVLLQHLIDQHGKGLYGPSTIPLDEEVLRHINVTSGVGGHVGLLKFGSELKWPVPLLRDEFKEVRDRLEANLTESITKNLKFNKPVDASALGTMTNAVKTAHEILDANIRKMTPSEYISAKRYLIELDAAMRALSTDTAQNYFTGTWVAKGKNVREFIDHMKEHGLTIAPAVSGDEAAYAVLLHALTAYDVNMVRAQPEESRSPNP